MRSSDRFEQGFVSAKTLIAIVIVLIVAAGGAYYVVQQSANTNHDNLTGTATLAELISRGGNWECSVGVPSGASYGPFEGIVYVAGDQIRANFAYPGDSRNPHDSMLQTGGVMYNWGDQATIGSKKTITSPKSGYIVEGQDSSTPVTYNCKPWSVDSSKFVVPTNIKFTNSPGA